MPAHKPPQLRFPNSAIFDEIEAVSRDRGLEKKFRKFDKDPHNFQPLNDLLAFEYNARALSLDYIDKIQKGIYQQGQFHLDMANHYANDSSDFDFVMEIVMDPTRMENQRSLDTLKNIFKDCIEAAFHLARHRIEFRKEARMQRIAADTADILQKVNHMYRRMNDSQLVPANRRQKDIDAALQVQPAALPLSSDQSITNKAANSSLQNLYGLRPASPQTLHRQQRQPSIPLSAPTQPQSIPAPSAAAQMPAPKNQGPSWIVSEEECMSIQQDNQFIDGFVRAYLLVLFSTAEILLPAKEFETAKINEFISVAKKFYPDFNINWKHKMEKVMNNLRIQGRQKVFEKIKEKGIGYAITNTNVKFYFKPGSMNCYAKSRCKDKAVLSTKKIGEYYIPESLNDFDYIVCILKPATRANITKVYADGTFIQVQK